MRSPRVAAATTAALCGALALSACGDAAGDAERAGTATAGAVEEPAALVAALRGAATPAEASAATHALLTRGGVPVTDLRGEQVGTVSAPVVPYRRTTLQLLKIAAEARTRTTRLTLEETATLLEVLGFPLAPLAEAVEERRDGSAGDGAGRGDADAGGGSRGAPAVPEAEVQEARRALEEAERQLEAQLRDVPASMRAQVEAQARAQLAEARRSLEAMTGRPPAPATRAGRAGPAAAPTPRVAGANLAALLRAMVRDARERPDDPDVWAALTLDALARAEVPALDLGSREVDPARVHWGLLEMELLIAALTHGATGGAPLAALSPARSTFHFAALKAPPNPCGALQEAVSGLGGLAGQSAEWGVGEAGSAIGESLVAAFGPPGADDALGKLKLLSQILALAEFYALGGAEVTVLTENPTHKVVEGSPGRKARFRARAGIDRDVADAYDDLMRQVDPAGARQIMADCGDLLGLPTFESPESQREKVKAWRIEWDVDVEPAGLATWSLADNALTVKGAMVTPLQSTGRGTGTAEFTMDIGEERKVLHSDRNARERTGYVRVTAKVKSSEPPTLSTFTFIPSTGGPKPQLIPVDAIVELSGGLIRELAMPESHATLAVTYHEAPGYTFNTMYSGARLYGTKCGGHVGTWKVNMAGQLFGRIPIYEGYLWATIGEDGTGTLRGEWDVRGMSQGRFLKGRYVMSGSARFDWSAQRLELTLTDVDAAVRHLDVEINRSGSGALTMVVPVTGQDDACR